MGITNRKLLFCYGISEKSVENKISTGEYNNRTYFDCFDYPFRADFGSPSLNLHPINIDDRTHLHRRPRYTPDLPPVTISASSEKSISTFTSSSYSPTLIILTYDDPNLHHAMKKYEPYGVRVKIVYCPRKHYEKKCHKKN